MGGNVKKQIQKALGSLPPCGNRCRFSESAICSSWVHPPSEIKSNFKFKTLRWRPKVAFDTVRFWRSKTVPDPPTLVSWKESKGNPQKEQGVFPLCRTLRILGKERKNTKKQGKSQNRRRKSQKAGAGGSGLTCLLNKQELEGQGWALFGRISVAKRAILKFKAKGGASRGGWLFSTERTVQTASILKFQRVTIRVGVEGVV